MITIVEDIRELKSQLQEWVVKKNFVEQIQNKKVLLKPNMGYPKPAPFTTSTKVIRKIVEILSELNAQQIMIGEGSTSHSNALENYEATGLIEELKDFNIDYIDLNKLKSIEVKLPSKVSHFLPKILNQVDIRISLPVIKFYEDDEGKFFLSNAIKNFFGLPPKEKYQASSESAKRDSLHDDLHKSVFEIYQSVEKHSQLMVIMAGKNMLLLIYTSVMELGFC